MKINIQTNKITTNLFGVHTQPRKITRYTNILKLVCGGGGGGRKKSPWIFVSPNSKCEIVDYPMIMLA